MQPPYYAVIFTSKRTDLALGYDEMSQKMVELAHQQEGFLGIESARNEIGITVSYWSSLEAIQRWKVNLDHIQAQRNGIANWYTDYTVRIAKVEREYSFVK
jgi:heme-degrading monooxygenase HmoA